MQHFIRQTAMAIVEIALYIAIIAVTYGIIGGAMVVLHICDPSDFETTTLDDPYRATLMLYLPMFIGSIVGILAVHHLIFKRSYSFSGWTSHRFLTRFAIGFGYSVILLSIGFVILVLTQYLSIDRIDFRPSLIFGFLLFFIIQSSFEELVMRSFLIPTIAHRSNVWVALIVSSLAFALLHGSNDNINVLSLVNIGLAGVLLGVLYLIYNQIWAPIGMHAGWNFLQGNIFGYEVSGIDVYSLIDSHETGPDIWTGGAFGFEGSLLATIALTLLISMLILRRRVTIAEYKAKGYV